MFVCKATSQWLFIPSFCYQLSRVCLSVCSSHNHRESPWWHSVSICDVSKVVGSLRSSARAKWRTKNLSDNYILNRFCGWNRCKIATYWQRYWKQAQIHCLVEYKVAQKSKRKTFVYIFAKYWPIINFFPWHIPIHYTTLWNSQGSVKWRRS